MCTACGTPFARRSRGRLTKGLLARRELPGEIKVILGFAGAVGAFGLFNVIFIFIIAPVEKSEVWFAGAANLAMVLSMGTIFMGLLRKTVWGWWYSTILFGLMFALYGVTAVLSAIEAATERDFPSFFGSGCGTVAFFAFAVVVGTPLWLLLRSRRRYFQLARRAPLRLSGMNEASR